jgi:hypothetical protein
VVGFIRKPQLNSPCRINAISQHQKHQKHGSEALEASAQVTRHQTPGGVGVGGGGGGGGGGDRDLEEARMVEDKNAAISHGKADRTWRCYRIYRNQGGYRQAGGKGRGKLAVSGVNQSCHESQLIQQLQNRSLLAKRDLFSTANEKSPNSPQGGSYLHLAVAITWHASLPMNFPPPPPGSSSSSTKERQGRL